MRRIQDLRICAAVGAAALTTLVAAPAAATSTHVADARDGGSTVDVRSVAYRDSEERASETVRVRDLPTTGRLVAVVGAPDSDVMYDATVRPRGDGTASTRLDLVNGSSRTARSCPGMTATWSPRTDTVEVSVPHTCLDFGTFMERHFMSVKTSGSGSQDTVRGVVVGRGTSPGCATGREMRALHRGDQKTRVHALLDTDGRPGDGAAGGYSRVYRSCSGGRPWFVDYEGRTNTLVDKGRVHRGTPAVTNAASTGQSGVAHSVTPHPA